MANRLIKETSPYLLQHAENPVEWYPWGEDAFSRARAEDKPILLSIGYSACHWCHVMAHESFENREIAALMNRHFICIKVDREERPDVDSVYMKAVQALTGGGGWPLTVFLTPEGKPFFGGTYFPPEDKQGMPGFVRVLTAISDAYQGQRGKIEQSARQLSALLAESVEQGAAAEPLTMDVLRQAHLALRQIFDEDNGGFGAAPKFPQPLALEFLLRYFHSSRDAAVLHMVEQTLEKMARGGIYDQVGGGFHRYATDARWMVPHFEKMLYDNALLSQVYLHAYLVTRKPLYGSIVEETLDYVLREMTGPHGGFYTAQDADSEGVEGKYYVWSACEFAEAAGKADQSVARYYGITSGGNFEGKNILHVAGVATPEAESVIQEVRSSLLKRREQRVRPGRDEKVLASWNGLMLASMAEAACVLGRPDYLTAAVANGSFLADSIVIGRRLKHSYREGQARVDGFLQDYALVIEGFLALHQATLDSRWLNEALKLGETMLEQFWDEDTSTFYDAGREQQDLFVRPRAVFDEVLPSGLSAATLASLKLALLTGNNQYQAVAAHSLRPMRELMSRAPLGVAGWLCALDFHLCLPPGR